MTDKPKFVSVGAAVQDVFLSKSEALDPVHEDDGSDYAELKMGGKADVDQINFSTGGGATNAAVTFARQGLDSYFMGSVADDPAGKAVLADLKQENVNATVTKSGDYNTGYSVILLANNGERTILTYRGASTHYTVDNFDMNELGHLDWMYVSSVSGRIEVLKKIFPQARSHNIKIAYNPGKAELKQANDLKPLLKEFVDVLIVNKEEMQRLVEGDTLEELAVAGLEFSDTVIVSDGPNGVGATDGKTYISAGMYEDVPVLDRTGAGDAFGSGFVSQIAQGKSLRRAVTFASANSTSVVQYIGAKAGILNSDAKIHEMPIKEKEL
ncbi:MAG: carbohydrate kinase family protein [Candidatus Saccharibacteria bacterium]|nr:carbohydrate kinase family protein [Candidatus Saccharibacteria bacterium]